jgi:hypothetical protein
MTSVEGSLEVNVVASITGSPYERVEAVASSRDTSHSFRVIVLCHCHGLPLFARLLIFYCGQPFKTIIGDLGRQVYQDQTTV